MKKIFFAAMAILIGTALTAQQPDANYKLIRYEWTLNADGSSDFHYRHEVQILRNRALVAYADKGETFVVYNPDLETLTVNEVYTIQKDGTRVNMPQNAFVYQLPEECADCGRFNHMRELAMVHTGMELGCTIVVDYTIHRQYNFLFERIPLKRDCPVEMLEVVVNYNHNDMDLQYTIDGSQYLNLDDVTRSESIGTDNMNRVLHYTFKNVPQAPREPYMPADIIPTLHLYNGTPQFTVADDGKDFSAAEEIVGKMTDKDTDKELITKIRNYVVDYIHLNDIAPAHLGYAVAAPAETWQTGCGTAADKAALLAAILRHEGYQASVTGDSHDQMGVLIDTLEYRFDVRSKAPAQLYGEAQDEVSTGNYTTKAAADLDTLEDGFFRLSFAGIPGEPTVSARNLALTRTTPLQSSACDLTSTETYTLPKGVKLLGGSVNEKLSYDGIGSLQISVKQSGKSLKVERKLKLEKSTIAIEDYANYRKLLATWQSIGGAMLRAK